MSLHANRPTVLRMRQPAAWKVLQLSVVMLWNAAVQSSARWMEQMHAAGLCCMQVLVYAAPGDILEPVLFWLLLPDSCTPSAIH